MNSKISLKENYFYVLLFLFASAYALFLTEKIPFFWEDINYFNEDFWQNTPYYGKNKTHSSFYNDAIKTIVNKEGFYSIGYSGLNERPLTTFFWRYAELFLGHNLFMYRFIKSIFFGIIAIVVAITSMQFLSKSMTLLLVLTYITMPQLWYAIFANADEAMFMHILTLSALFIYFYKYQSASNTFKLFLYGLLIFVLARLSILFKHEGRILYVGIFVYTLIKNYKELFYFKNYFLIFVLFLISFPILGLFGGSTLMDFDKAKLGGNNEAEWIEFFFGLMYPLMIIGPLFLLFLASLFYFLLNHKSLNKEDSNLFIFLFLFFIIELGITFFAHGFKITIQDFGRVTFIFFTAIYLLLVFLCLDRTRKLLIGKNAKIFTFILYTFIFYLIFNNIYLVNQIRGAWGDYVIGFNDIKDEIDAKHNNSIIFVESILTTTPIALSKNVIQPYDLVANGLRINDFVKAKLNKYDSVFLVTRTELSTKSGEITLVIKQKANDISLYGYIKKIFRRSSNQYFYLYMINKENIKNTSR